MDHAEIRSLDAVTLRDRMVSGDLTAEAVASAFIARITAREDEVRAWAWFDPEQVLAQARALDARRAAGEAPGALHGLPVGLKDVIDTAGILTENGCAVDQGRVPMRDAFVVERLRAAGAVIMGKTTTTELAYLAPSKTRNPNNLDHTPGGSSAGSAAGVADGMIPLAIGTQTGGSVIRPASFCGVVGFKPSIGAIPRRGVLLQSHTLDTLGTFARDLSGAALLAQVLFGFDAEDAATMQGPIPDLLGAVHAGPQGTPRLAVSRTPYWDQGDADMHEAFEKAVAKLVPAARPVDLPEPFSRADAMRRLINFAEMAHYYRDHAARGVERLSTQTQEALAAGAKIAARDYLEAVDMRPALNAALDTLLQRHDAIICPAAPGQAPNGHSSTGNAIFNGLWTLCGTPAVTLPVLRGATGLPIGLQLIGRRGEDARLLSIAAWVARSLAG